MARGPVTGYDFGNKRQYRRTVYAFVDRCLGHRPVRERRVLLMEDVEALEVKFLLQHGYRPDNLVAVNVNAAVLATVTRHLDAAWLPRIRTMTGDVFDVAQRCRRAGETFDVLHLDFTGPFTETMRDRLEDFRNEIVRNDSIVIVNMLRGREFDDLVRIRTAAQRHIVSSAKEVRDVLGRPFAPSAAGLNDMSRVAGTLQALQGFVNEEAIGCHFHLAGLHPDDTNAEPSVRFGSYRTGTQTMRWVAAHLHAHRRGWMNALPFEQMRTMIDFYSQAGGAGYGMGLFPPCWLAIGLALRAGVILREREHAEDGTTFGATYPYAEINPHFDLRGAWEQLKKQIVPFLSPRTRTAPKRAAVDSRNNDWECGPSTSST